MTPPAYLRLKPIVQLLSLAVAGFLLTHDAAGQATAAARPRLDLSRLVVVGDSLLAGFQNNSLAASQQVHAIAEVIARQANVELPLPLIADPGIPNMLQLLNPGPPTQIAPAPGYSTGRINPLLQPMNLAVPGHSVREALEERPDVPFDSLTDLILGLPGLLQGVSRSQVGWAEALQPTAIIVWIGAVDTLGAALNGDASLVTPDAEFTAAYTELMDRLAATGAALVVANLPDVTVIPYLTSAEQVASTIGLPAATIAAALGIRPGDFVTPDAFPIIPAILTGAQAGPLPANVVLNAGDVAIIRAATARLNAFIAAKAAEKGAALVDTHALLNSFHSKGIVVGGQRLTTTFLGGIFSLDGFHPTNTAAAVTANAFIKVMNQRLRAGIPPVNVRYVAAEDPLVLPGVGHPASCRKTVHPETGKSMRAILAPRSARPKNH